MALTLAVWSPREELVAPSYYERYLLSKKNQKNLPQGGFSRSLPNRRRLIRKTASRHFFGGCVGEFNDAAEQPHDDYENQRYKRKYFNDVITAYRTMLDLPPIAAIAYDHEARARKWSPAAAHFIADVELASRRVLGSNGLLGQFKKLVEGEEVPPVIAKRIVNLCSRIYISRKLRPTEYFRTTRPRIRCSR